MARRARLALDEARDEVARCLGCEPGEVVFTSGGTESDNLAVLGRATRPGRGTVLCSAVEHHAVRNACEAPRRHRRARAPRRGARPRRPGRGARTPDVGLVSVMLVNNEVGTVQPLAEVAALVAAHAPRALLHTDAVAAVGWLDVAAADGGGRPRVGQRPQVRRPQGRRRARGARRGAARARAARRAPRSVDRRPGTHDVAGVVGMAAALRVATDAGADDRGRRGGARRDRLADGPASPSIDGRCTRRAVVGRRRRQGGFELPPRRGRRRPGGAPRAARRRRRMRVGGLGVRQRRHRAEPRAAGHGPEPGEAKSAVRFSLGYTTTDAEIDHVLAVMPKVVERLRA